MATFRAEATHFIHPVKINNTDGVCPSEEQHSEAIQQVKNEVLNLLTPGLTEHNPVSNCSAIDTSSPSGYYWVLPATGPPAVHTYCAPPWFTGDTQLCYKWRADGDADQCGGGVPNELCANVDHYTANYLDNTDRRSGGCIMQWKIR